MLYLEKNSIHGNLCKTFRDFLDNQKGRIMLNSQKSIWVSDTAGVPQCSILPSLIFLIYIKDISKCLPASGKLFVDNRFLFPVLHDSNSSRIELNDGLTVVKVGLS